MKKLELLSSVICAALFLLPAAASAQATRTWISGVGADTNPCSRTSPCKTFPGAISQTAIGGEIDTLDPGGFGAVTVNKAITLADEGVGEGGILVAGTNGITVNCNTDPACMVIIRGLVIDGGPIGSNSLAGVKFIAGGGLIIQHCTIRNFTAGSPNGYGVFFAPSATQTYFLAIDDTTIVDNAPAGGTGGGVFVQPTGSGTINVAIDRVQSSHNGFGFGADASFMTAAPGAGIFMSITDSEASGNQNGGVAAITAASGGATVNVNVDHVTINNNSVGVNAKGSAATIRLANSKVITNQTGFKQTSGPTVTTLGNNQFFDNATPGPAPVLAGPQ
jgi:hypothetical protein